MSFLFANDAETFDKTPSMSSASFFKDPLNEHHRFSGRRGSKPFTCGRSIDFVTPIEKYRHLL